MDKEIVLRIKTPEGYLRLNISTSENLKFLKQKICDAFDFTPAGLSMRIDSETGPQLVGTDVTRISSLPRLKFCSLLIQ